MVATAFLYLQWFHYMRQGYGLSRMYFRATPEGQVAGSRDITTDLVDLSRPDLRDRGTVGDDGRRFSICQ